MNSKMDIAITSASIDEAIEKAKNLIDILYKAKNYREYFFRNDLDEKDNSILELKIMEAVVGQADKYHDYRDINATKIKVTFN